MEMKNLGSYNRCLLLFICLINFSGLFSAVPVSPNSIDSVLVEKFIWDAETDIRVSCSNFELYLSYTGYMLYDNSEINRLQKEMSVLPSSESEYVDTRCKIFFFRADTVVYTACIGRFTALIDGNMYRSTERLFNTIDSLITGKPQIRNIVHADKDIISQVDYTDEAWAACIKAYTRTTVAARAGDAPGEDGADESVLEPVLPAGNRFMDLQQGRL